MQYSLIVCASLIRDRLEVEVQRSGPDGSPEDVALVYKSAGGWGIDYADDAFATARDAGFDAAVERAKALLEEYQDHNADEPPEALSEAGRAAWLQERNTDAEDL